MVEPFARNNCHLRAHLILPVILPVREVAPDAAGDLNAGNKGDSTGYTSAVVGRGSAVRGTRQLDISGGNFQMS